MARKYSKRQSQGRKTRIKSSQLKKRSAGKKDLKAFAKAISEKFQNDSSEE